MTTFKRIAINDWEVTAENGNHFKVVRGQEYITGPKNEDGHVIVFSSFWVPVPVSVFAGERRFT
jgi:hypothetical protein